MQRRALPVPEPEGGAYTMASARNMVIAGDYQGCRVFCMTGKLAYISGTMKKMDDIVYSMKSKIAGMNTAGLK